MGSKRLKAKLARVLSFVVVAGAYVCAHAQTMGAGVGSATPPARKTVKVRGVVLDRISHQPIERALVDGMFDAVLTDHDGRFELMLPAGHSNLQAKRPGYNNGRGGTWQPFEISDGMADIMLFLTPAATVSGHVTVAGEADPSMVRLEAYQKAAINGRGQWMPRESAQADSEGKFRFVELDAPGTYVFCSMARVTPGTAREMMPTGLERKCFPGRTDFGSVTPLKLMPGQHEQFDVQLERERLYPVIVSSVTDRQPRFQIFDQSGMSFPAGAFPTDKPGDVRVMLPRGEYRAESLNWGEQPVYGSAAFTVTGKPLEVQLTTAPVAPIPVNIHREFEQKANFPTQTISMGLNGQEAVADPGVQLGLIADGKVIGAGFVGAQMQHVNGGGPEAFEVRAMPGRWRPQVFGYQGYVSSLRSGAVDLLREPLVVGPGGSAEPIELTVRNDGGEIDCGLKASDLESTGGNGGQRPGRFQVVAVAQFPAAMRIAQSGIMFGQAARIANLAPGDYRVAAFDAVPAIDLDDAEGLSQFMSKGQTVHVDANGTARVELELTHLEEGSVAQ